jgi:hypothetical protein
VAWAVACIALGAHQLAEILRSVLEFRGFGNGLMMGYAVADVALIIGGILCLRHLRFAVLAMIVVVAGEAAVQCIELFLLLSRHRVNQVPPGFRNLSLVVSGTNTALLLLGTLAGVLIGIASR